MSLVQREETHMTMRLKVDGISVDANYLPYEGDKAGAVLQLLVNPVSGQSALHRKLVDGFNQHYGEGVMDQPDPVRAEGNTEIRLLQATMLEAIDIARMIGCGVEEIHPYL